MHVVDSFSSLSLIVGVLKRWIVNRKAGKRRLWEEILDFDEVDLWAEDWR